MASDIGDDQFPIEFSLALLGTDAEVRVLFETRTSDPSMRGRWSAGQELNRRLEQRHGVSLSRLRSIEDLFSPVDPSVRYAMWHSVCWRRSRAPKFKIYLNPHAQGRRRAPVVVAEALRRLGFSGAAQRLSTCVRSEDEIKFFSLDLDDSTDARVKVYKVHHRARRQDIEGELSVARSYRADHLRAFIEAITASWDGPFCGLPISTYLSLTSEADCPAGATIHFPIRDYVENDRVASERVRGFLRGADRTTYERAVEAFAARPLQSGIGMHSYVSLGLDGGPRRVTVYLAPEVYRTSPARLGHAVLPIAEPTST
jgi:DMATS type aromatic prenyltransferase